MDPLTLTAADVGSSEKCKQLVIEYDAILQGFCEDGRTENAAKASAIIASLSYLAGELSILENLILDPPAEMKVSDYRNWIEYRLSGFLEKWASFL